MAWTAGQLAFLGGVLFLAWVCEGLRRAVVASAAPARRRMVCTAWVVALAGVAAASAQAVIDMYVGIRAADKPEMSDIFDRVQCARCAAGRVHGRTAVPVRRHDRPPGRP
ncbi:hypothetical protein ABT084_21075 [Streptomyces sp. NPDC002138]|uniref:hypothetical protein n=1 Tax=Streptomyces sp. NPDC002138 TaxID=3154410 RepID=UPI00332F1574